MLDFEVKSRFARMRRSFHFLTWGGNALKAEPETEETSHLEVAYASATPIPSPETAPASDGQPPLESHVFDSALEVEEGRRKAAALKDKSHDIALGTHRMIEQLKAAIGLQPSHETIDDEAAPFHPQMKACLQDIGVTAAAGTLAMAAIKALARDTNVFALNAALLASRQAEASGRYTQAVEEIQRIAVEAQRVITALHAAVDDILHPYTECGSEIMALTLLAEDLNTSAGDLAAVVQERVQTILHKTTRAKQTASRMDHLGENAFQMIEQLSEQLLRSSLQFEASSS